MKIGDIVYVSGWGKVSKGVVVAQMDEKVVVHSPSELINTNIDSVFVDKANACLSVVDRARREAASALKRRDEYQETADKHEQLAREFLEQGRRALRGELVEG